MKRKQIENGEVYYFRDSTEGGSTFSFDNPLDGVCIIMDMGQHREFILTHTLCFNGDYYHDDMALTAENIICLADADIHKKMLLLKTMR